MMLKGQLEEIAQGMKAINDLRTEIHQLKADKYEMTKALRAALEWIDAIPKDISLPAMPGSDRGWVDNLIAEIER